MAIGIVYELDKNNEITRSFEMDYNQAIGSYWGQRLPNGGKYYVGVKGKEIPFKRKQKALKDIKRPRQES